MAKNREQESESKKSEKEIFLEQLKKQFGKDSGLVVTNIDDITIEKFKTGSLALDIYLEGGFPKGKMVEGFGINQGGKTSLFLEAAGKFQEKYPEEHVMIVDLEDTFTPEYASELGLNPFHNFILTKPKTGEDAFEVLINFAKTFKGGLIILDSVSLLLPVKEEDNEMGSAQMGSQARLMSQGLRKLFPHASKNGTTILFVNQIRTTFDMYAPVATSGGKSLPFYARTRLHLSKVKGEEGLSNGCNIKLEKATYGREGNTVRTTRLIKGKFDVLTEIIQIGSECGLIERNGAFYKYDGSVIGQGQLNARKTLEDNPELADELETKIRKHYGIE